MQTKLKCAYRVHPNGEIMIGCYYVFEGYLDKIAFSPTLRLGHEILKEYVDGNYENDYPRSSLLIAELVQSAGAYMAIDFCCIGALLVYPDRIDLKIFELFGVQDTFRSDFKVGIEGEPIGLAKTFVKTYECPMIIAKLIAAIDENQKQFVFYKGKWWDVDFDVRLATMPSFARWMEMNRDSKAIGIIKYEGEEKLLYIEDNDRIIMKEAEAC